VAVALAGSYANLHHASILPHTYMHVRMHTCMHARTHMHTYTHTFIKHQKSSDKCRGASTR